ncbi:MAG: hypothetical protein LBB42_02005, partial [Coriobacteriales bacterium]|nr:hypothetical protein [Coriobacteriales bacterium]
HSRPFMVIRPGSPGPAPIKYTSGFVAMFSLSLALVLAFALALACLVFVCPVLVCLGFSLPRP